MPCSDLYLVQGSRGSRQIGAQVCRGCRNDWGDSNEVELNPFLFLPLPTSFHRYTHRLTPVTNTCVANVLEIKSLAQRVLKPFLAQHPGSEFRVRLKANEKKDIGEIDSSLACTQYKIELKVRNHNSISRQTIIDTIVSCVPSEWSVNLCDAEVFILVEVFKVYKKDVPEATV